VALRGYITPRIRPQWECERGNFALLHSLILKVATARIPTADD
jgi:hypothetical protein